MEGLLAASQKDLPFMYRVAILIQNPWNTKVGSITVPLTSCLIGLESAVRQLTIFVFICITD